MPRYNLLYSQYHTFETKSPVFPMRFEFKNIGIVESASIELNGLTVLTGLNDTGKSFLAKGIYSVIKTILEANDYYKKISSKGLESQLNQIISIHRRVAGPNPHRDSKLYSTSSTKNLGDGLDPQRPETITPSLEFIDALLTDLSEQLKKTTTENKIIPPYRTPDKVEAAIQEINSFKTTISENAATVLSPDDIFSIYFSVNCAEIIFGGQISSLDKPGYSLQVLVFEGETKLVEINEDKTHGLYTFEYLNPVLINDAVIIETPTVIQLEPFITYSLAYSQGDSSILPKHYFDLIKKMATAPTIYQSDIDYIFEDIKKVIGGHLTYDQSEKGFIFSKDNGANVRSPNIATGIKSFGILQRLISSGVINNSTYLMIDEPEVHLHPQWEIEYARLIVLLSKAGIPIIISTHSPYFIRAITTYVKKYETESITNFYYGEKNKDSKRTVFENVTSNLEPILKTLAEPMQQLLINR